MRVFIYELDGARLPAADTATRRALFGPPMDWRGNTFASGPTYMDAVLSRLLPNRTLNPALADLFFLHQPSSETWCHNASAQLDGFWAQHDSQQHNYFRRRGGSDHFTVALWAQTFRVECPSWRTDESLRQVRKFVGVLHSPWEVGRSRSDVESDARRHSMIEVPYGGSVHHSRHWTDAERRSKQPLLIAAAFNDHGHGNEHGQMDLRRRLRRQCERAGTPRCRYLDLLGYYQLYGGAARFHLMRETLRMYRTATFSLQPPGDDPARKGIIDSITSGCIPVLFHPEQQLLWPHHWAGWANESSVLLSASGGAASGDAVLRALQDIPQERVRRMQRVIAMNAHRLVYAFDDAPSERVDAMSLLMQLVLPSSAG